MRIYIIGGTGKTGRKLIKQSLDQGHSVTAMVRNPDSLKIEHPELPVVKGNVLDAPIITIGCTSSPSPSTSPPGTSHYSS